MVGRKSGGSAKAWKGSDYLESDDLPACDDLCKEANMDRCSQDGEDLPSGVPEERRMETSSVPKVEEQGARRRIPAKGERLKNPGSPGNASKWEDLVAEASSIEIEAMHFDQQGNTPNAVECYRRVAAKLFEAAQKIPDGHAVKALMEQRAEEASKRVASLEAGLQGVPSARHEDSNKISLMAQGVLASSLASTAAAPVSASSSNPGGRDDFKIRAAAAAIGGGAGLLLAGPVSAAALGVAAAYTTTKDNTVGATARRVSAAGLKAADIAVDKGYRAADVAIEEGCRRILRDADQSAPKTLLHSQTDKCVRAVASTLQDAMPRKKLSEEAKRIRARYPDRVPVICERSNNCALPDIEKRKFVIPGGMICGEFKYIVHKQVAQAMAGGVAMDQTIYLFVNGISPKTSTPMSELYEQHKADDGFLHVSYTAENTLGSR